MNYLGNTQEYVLDNGFRICHFRRPGPAVEIQIWVKTGSIHEDAYLGCGLSHFLEHMLFQGSRNYPGHAITDRVTAMGGTLNACTSYDHTSYRFQLPRGHWREGVKMLCAMLRYPELPAERFAAEREVILRECEMGRDSVSRRLFERFIGTMFVRHPLRHPIIGYRELISGVTRDTAMEYYEKRYTPERAFAVVVGDCDEAELFAAFGEEMGDWQRKNLAELPLEKELFPRVCRKSEVIFPDPLARMMWGIQAPDYGDRELPALEIAVSLLGMGDTSLLGSELVLKKELAQDVNSFSTLLGGAVISGVTLECEPEKFERMHNAFYRNLAKAADGALSAAAMEREKMQQYADRLRTLRELTGIAGEIGGSMLYTGTPDAGDRYLERLLAVDVDSMRAAAAKYFRAESCVEVRQLPEARQVSHDVKARETKVDSGVSACGVRYLHVHDKSLPLAYFTMVLPGGGIFETAGEAGIAALCAKTVTCGGGELSENRILRKFDELGCDFSVSAGANSLLVELSVPKQKLAEAVIFTAKVLSSAEFPKKPFMREKQIMLDEFDVRSQQPVKRAMSEAAAALFGAHPYANGGKGRADTVETLTAFQVQEFFRKLFIPSRTIIGFGGDCSVREAAKLVEKFTGYFRWYEDPYTLLLPQEPLFPAELVRRQISLPREQTVVVRMLPGLAVTGDRSLMIALDILVQMENGLGSELFKNVREKNALSYSVGMSFNSGFQRGSIYFYAMTAAGAGDKVLALLDEEILRLSVAAVTNEEFEAARAGALNSLEKIADHPEALLRTGALDLYYNFAADTVLKQIELVKEFTCEQYCAALREIFADTSGGAVTVVMPQ